MKHKKIIHSRKFQNSFFTKLNLLSIFNKKKKKFPFCSHFKYFYKKEVSSKSKLVPLLFSMLRFDNLFELRKKFYS